MTATRFFIALPEPEKARLGGEFGFQSHGADGFASELQTALRSDALFQKWLAQQDNPDDIDPTLATTDANAHVSGEQNDLHIMLEVATTLPGAVLKHRLRLLAGSHWQLRDVR